MLITRRDFVKTAAAATLGGPALAVAAEPTTGPAAGPAADRLLTHRFGVNYVPSRQWNYFWNDFDADALARDFDAVAGLGADHLRLVPIWPWFQPNAAHVSAAHLDRLDAVMDLAGGRGLDVCVTLFTGWLSGFAFKPTFHGGVPFYASPAMRAAQLLFVDKMAGRLRGRANFLGFDLGNEINCCWEAPPAEADAWMADLFEATAAACPDAVHVNGVDHQPWFRQSRGAIFTPAALCAAQRIVPIHAYILFAGALDHGRAMDPPCVRLAANMAALVRSFAGDASKPVWLQEYGASPDWMARDHVPRFLRAATLAGIEGGISWFTWWGSHDIRRSFEFPAVEYELGLLTVEQKVKPAGEAFRELAAAHAGKAVSLPAAAAVAPPADGGRTWPWLLERPARA